MMARILLVTNLPTPYRLPLYRRIDAMLEERGRALRVLFLGYAKSVRSWTIAPEELRGLRHAICTPAPAEAATRAGRDRRAIRCVLRDARAFAPEAVVIAWAMDYVALRLLLALRRRGIPCIVVSGETLQSARNNPMPRLRRIFREPFFRLAARFLTYGTRASEYLTSCGVPAARITTGTNVAQPEYFNERAAALRASGASERFRSGFRTAAGGAFACHLLFVGYLHGEKGLAGTIEMMRRLARADVALHVVGAGPDEAAMRALVEGAGLSSTVFFHGYRQSAELPLYYAAADVLVFPSTVEVYGLVMAEAVAAGLPVLASSLAGGTIDLVEDGVNGLVVNPLDADAFARAVASLADDPELRARMASASLALYRERLSTETSAARWVEAIDAVLAGAAIDAHAHEEAAR